jgi:hypothetical protein
MEIDVLMNNVGQSNEIIEHITFKRRLRVIEHVVYILFIDLDCCYEITNKKSLNCVNLVKEHITSNIYITKFKPNKVSTLVCKDKLNLGEGIMGASNAIFMKKMWYLNKTHLTKLIIEIHLDLMF